MDYKFTAQMEDKLDDIASGDLEWHEVLKEFYNDFHPIVMKIKFKKDDGNEKYNRLLGVYPDTGSEIYVSDAKFGPVFKMMAGSKIKYAPIKPPLTMEGATLADSLKAFEYPKEIGKFERKMILLQTGQHGFYLIHGNDKYNIGDKTNINLVDAIAVIKQKKTDLPVFKSSTREYRVLNGEYGKYLKVSDIKTKKNFNVSLPPNEDISKMTLQRAHEIAIAKYTKVKKATNDKQKIDITKT
jgi:DNA topoisomerase-1